MPKGPRGEKRPADVIGPVEKTRLEIFRQEFWDYPEAFDLKEKGNRSLRAASHAPGSSCLGGYFNGRRSTRRYCFYFPAWPRALI
jgi:hypothetical protein